MEISVLTLQRQNNRQKTLSVLVRHYGKEIKSVKLEGKEILGKIGLGYIQDLQDQIELQDWDNEDL